VISWRNSSRSQETIGDVCVEWWKRRLGKMSLDRWEPLRDMMSLRDTMERLIQENFGRPAGSILPALRGAVPLDVIEKGDSFEVRASLPGIKPEDVNISVQGETLTIRGETTGEHEHKEENWILRERRSGSFYRSVTLPAPLDADRANARFEQGVLVLTIPKAETAKAKQIPVTGAQAGKQDATPINQQRTTPTGSISGATTTESSQTSDDVVAKSSMDSMPMSDTPSGTL
jgi:HSP20 family protein